MVPGRRKEQKKNTMEDGSMTCSYNLKSDIIYDYQKEKRNKQGPTDNPTNNNQHPTRNDTNEINRNEKENKYIYIYINTTYMYTYVCVFKAKETK